MYSLMIETKQGGTVELTHNPNYTITHISGLLPPHNGINISTAGTQPGGEYNSHHVEVRNIVITLYLEGNIEANRQRLYTLFPYESPCTIYFQNKNRNVRISGYVELIDGDPFTKRETIQISILCPKPFWEGLQQIQAELSRSLSGFEFPFTAPEDGVVISGSYPHPVGIVSNPGTVEVGFVAEIRVDAAEPTLSLSEKHSVTPESIMQNRILIPLSEQEYDPETQSLSIYINHNLINQNAYTTDFLTYENHARDLRLTFPENILRAGDIVTAEVYHTEDIQKHYDETHVPTEVAAANIFYEAYYDKPDWYDETLDTITMVQNGVQLVDGEAWSWYVYSLDENKIQIYHSGSSPYIADTESPITMNVDGVRQNQKIIDLTRNATVSLPDEILYTPFSYTEHDLIRVYMNGEKLTGWNFETVEVVEVSGNSQLLCLHLGTQMTSAVTLQIISSLTGEDVSDYTDTQVDEGLRFVDDLTLFNVSTNERILFSGIRFRPGDALELSTVSGEIYVKCLESTWLEPGENLMYAVSPDSDFPKLRPGENHLSLSALTCQDLITGYLTAKQLYGGV